MAIHSVQFYDAHTELIDRLSGIVSSALAAGDSLLLVVTQDHRRQLVDALEREGIDVPMHTAEKRLAMYDTEEALAMFMVGERPSAPLFLETVKELLSGVKQSAGHGVVIFGEMVAVLWERGNSSAALALEQLGNSLLEEAPCHIHCAYPRSLFSNDQPGWPLSVSVIHTLSALTPSELLSPGVPPSRRENAHHIRNKRLSFVPLCAGSRLLGRG